MRQDRRHQLGRGLAGALLATDWSRFAVVWLGAGDILSSGLMMGTVMTAMLLGHWYLNTPTMVLAPLQRLVRWSGGSTLLRAAVCGVGIASFLMGDGPGEGAAVDFTFWLFVGFRWLAGLLGVGLMIYMTRETLKVPNTQSATGILYAAVILVFLGELVGQLLTVDARHPM